MYTVTVTSLYGCTDSDTEILDTANCLNNCNPPTNLTAPNITHNSVYINWDPGGTESSWIYRCGLRGTYVKTVAMSSTMSPGVKIDCRQIS